MVFPNITRKNNASALNTEKKLFDTDVNQLLDAVQDGTKDIKTNSVTCIGNYVYLNTNKGIRYDTVTSKVQVSHNGVSWSDIGGNPSSLSLTAGEAISNNLFCDIGTDGKTYKSSGTKGIGFTKTSVVLNGTVEVQISGVVNGFTGLTIGSTYYAGLNGVISTSVSSIEVGVALSATSLFINVESAKFVPIGVIQAWHKSFTNTPTLSYGWVECNGQVLNDAASVYNGQTLPNLNATGTFMKGNVTSGTTGGTATNNVSHTHTVNVGSNSNGGNTGNITGNFGTFTTSNSGSTVLNNLPTYMDIVWIIKVK